MSRRLGTVSVPAVGWGAMPISVPPRPSEADALAMVKLALDLGVELIDTADVYCRDDDDLGHNERLIARGLAAWGRGRSVLVATQGGLRRPGGAWVEDGRPEALRAACEASLRALGVEQIGLYQLHAPDPDVPFADQVGTLFDLQSAGKIAQVGLSNVSADQLREAVALGPIASVQNRMNPLDLGAVHDGVLAACEAAGVAFIAYSPVGGREERAELLGHPALLRAARELDVTAGTVALAWLLRLSPAIVVIPGASRPENLRANLAALELILPDGIGHSLDAAFGMIHDDAACV